MFKKIFSITVIIVSGILAIFFGMVVITLLIGWNFIFSDAPSIESFTPILFQYFGWLTVAVLTILMVRQFLKKRSFLRILPLFIIMVILLLTLFYFTF